eukprot:2438219-Pleurochrysis_carterae.AAC.2
MSIRFRPIGAPFLFSIYFTKKLLLCIQHVCTAQTFAAYRQLILLDPWEMLVVDEYGRLLEPLNKMQLTGTILPLLTKA